MRWKTGAAAMLTAASTLATGQGANVPDVS